MEEEQICDNPFSSTDWFITDMAEQLYNDPFSLISYSQYKQDMVEQDYLYHHHHQQKVPSLTSDLEYFPQFEQPMVEQENPYHHHQMVPSLTPHHLEYYPDQYAAAEDMLEHHHHPKVPSLTSHHLEYYNPSTPFEHSPSTNEICIYQHNHKAKKDFVHYENVHGQTTNVLQGLELHTGIFNELEQEDIVNCVYHLQSLGQKGELKERTYSQPKKWMPGKGRVTIQFGCCYNYALDREGNEPGIMRDEEVDSIPPLLKAMIRRMVNWSILPKTCVPDSCIINIYDKGDCIPPHIDHHDFLQPFCTVSFLTECDILFGSKIEVVGPGKFSAPTAISLPRGSVLVLKGNGADVAKHCVPGVPGKRISITFRKMDESRLPYSFAPNPKSRGTQSLVHNDAYGSRHNAYGHDGMNGNKRSSRDNKQREDYDDAETAVRRKRLKSGITVSEAIYI